MKPGNLAVSRPTMMLMLMLVVLLLGGMSFRYLSLELLPRFQPPVLAVYTGWDGASPREVALLVTEPMEKAAATVGGIRELSSVSAEGGSVIVCEFAWGENLEVARDQLKERLAMIPLPEGAREPQVMRYDPASQPGLRLSIWGDVSDDRLEAVARDILAPGLESIAGVAAVEIGGLDALEVHVLLNQKDLTERGMDILTVAQAIGSGNVMYPAGAVVDQGLELNVRVLGEYTDLRELGRVVVGVNEQGFVLLEQVAEIREQRAAPVNITRTNGEPSVTLSVRKEGDANIVQVNRAVLARLEELEAQLPDVNVAVTMDQAQFIEDAIGSIGRNLLVGAGLAVLVMLTSMGSILSPLIIAVSIPFSVVATFVMMHFGGLTLNLMSLGGLALGVGMLVDNSIVVIENIYRHIQAGIDVPQAAAQGANEVAGAITGATLTTLAVFLPVVYVGGMTGELFRELALTVSFSLLASLVVALTVIPMLASKILGYGKWKLAVRPRSNRGLYAQLVAWCLGRRLFVLAITGLLIAVTLVPFFRLGREFLPAIDEGSFGINITLPVGTPLAVTGEWVAEVEALLSEHGDVDVFTSRIGPGGGASLTERGKHEARIDVSLKPQRQTTVQVMNWVREETAALLPKEASVSVVSQSEIGTLAGSNSLQVELRGTSLEQVETLALALADEIRAVPGTADVTTNLDSRLPEKQVQVDRQRVAALGLAPIQVAAQINAAMCGVTATRLNQNGTSLDVRVQFSAEDTAPAENLRRLPISLGQGRSLPLIMVADIVDGYGPLTIHRSGQQTAAQVSAAIQEGDLGGIISQVEAIIGDFELPDGYQARIIGSGQLMQEGFSSLYTALALAIILVYIVMAALFESLLHPIVIILTLPLAAVGALWVLYGGGFDLGITAMIGLILLAGIVVNNGIVMVAAINRLRAEGITLQQAIIAGARMRLRPILMTASTTVLAMLPLALGVGDGSELQAPLAAGVIGGMISATLMTLLVLPVVYSMLAGRSRPPKLN